MLKVLSVYFSGCARLCDSDSLSFPGAAFVSVPIGHRPNRAMASPAYQRLTSTGAGVHTPMRVDGQDELPFTAAHRSSGRQYRKAKQFPNEEKENRCRGCVNHTRCVGWTYVLTLFVAATLQPVLLKILLDNLMPYRFPLVVVLCGIHFVVMAVIVAWKYCFGSSTLPPNMYLFSKSHCFASHFWICCSC